MTPWHHSGRSRGRSLPPLRLVLGTAALPVARGKLDALQRNFTEWEHLGPSTEVAASPV